MKKVLLFLFCLLSFNVMAKKPPVLEIDPETASRIELINDSTIQYYQVYGIQVANRKDVYTAIIKIPKDKKEKPSLMIMAPGSFIWEAPDNKPGNYILFSGKAFDRIILRISDEF